MSDPDDRRYTREHEWALADGKQVTVGVTRYAQDALGDVVFVDLPSEGAEFTAGDSFGEVESTKSVSDLYAPCSGRVSATNEKLSQNPELVNTDPPVARSAGGPG